MTWFAFDFDGVIADTKWAVEEAYRMTGVTFPEGRDWWGVPGPVWLADEGFEPDEIEMILAEKYYNQKQLVAGAKLLPGATVARLVQGPRALVTASPLDVIAVRVATSQVQWDAVYAELTKDQKIEVLRDELTGEGVYVDDLEVGREIADAAGWRFVHYRGQDSHELMKEVTGA